MRVLRGPTPLVIGISGHRDLRAQDVAALSAAVDTFFARVRERFPNSTPLLLSGLAAGADQLVAERAAAHGIDYVAVLPMPLDAYREDFATEGRAAFEAALAGAGSVLELPFEGDHSAASLRGNGSARAAQYGALGHFLAANSMILLALWDGRPVAAEGGTSHVVALAETQNPHGDRTRPRAYVYHIVTPRASHPQTVTPAFAAEPFTPGDPALAALDDVDLWNREAAALARELGETVESAFDERLYERAFELADALAARDQEKTNRAIDTVYWSALIAGTALVPYGNLGDYFTGFQRAFYSLPIVFLCSTVVSVATVFRLHRAEVQTRFHDYRALAEGLRVQKAFLNAGIAVDASERYLEKHRAELTWIRRTIAAAFLVTRISRAGATSEPAWTRVADAERSWIEAQRAYFARAAARNAAAARRANVWALCWFRVSVAAGFLMALDGAVRFAGAPGLGIAFGHGELDCKSLSLSLLAWAALLAALAKSRSNLRGFGVSAERYRAMERVFAAASEKLAAMLETRRDEDLARAVAAIVDLGEEALAENSEWLLSQRARPLELVWTG